jgi:hypothetical protein
MVSFYYATSDDFLHLLGEPSNLTPCPHFQMRASGKTLMTRDSFDAILALVYGDFPTEPAHEL